ncbi:MAG TPA: T9SS type A sorting domain-containing protein [Bacteroidia bacterium]|nr:T9SS type A sorting domain-containing protein [Bacteroidia bacterium]
MKKITFLLSTLILGIAAQAQITITKNDFAIAGDTFRISNAAGLGITDLDSTGANRTWDYSALTAVTQTVDTFVSVSSTPLLYQLYFNNQFVYPNTKATVATKINTPTLPPGAPITISNTYGFYKVNTSAFSQVGFGATISGLPTSIPYDSLDYVYRFPMNYGNVDSCKYKFQLSIPNIGYLRRRARRVNVVDGWGTLITPFGTFNTLRVKSTTYATDTIYITQLMFGTQIVQQPTVEYKWIGTNSGIPYLTINATADSIPQITSVSYRDSLRVPLISIGIEKLPTVIRDAAIYPNPATSQSLITFTLEKAGKVQLELVDAQGRLIEKLMEATLPEGIAVYPIDMSSKAKGLYFVRINNGSSPITLKLSKQ